ncbi:hypothetical protein ACQY0O_006735 [Thecaphora frezii]
MPTLPTLPAPSSSLSNAHSHSHSPSPSATSAANPIHTSAPISTPLTAAFPATSSLSRSDIESLLAQSPNPTADPHQAQRDNAYFDAFFHSLPQVKVLYAHHAQLLKQNEDKAKQNVALQQPLEALRAETQQLFDRASSYQAQWPQLEAQMNELYKRFSPSSLHFHLTQSASKLNDRSEELANAYVEGLPYPAGDEPSPTGQTVKQVLDVSLTLPDLQQSRPRPLLCRFRTKLWALKNRTDPCTSLAPFRT